MHRTFLHGAWLLALVGCVSSSSDDFAEEDAAADAASSGKADDGSGFELGLFSSHPDRVTAGTPVLAAFHQDGQLDLAVAVDEAEDAYLRGTFKVYRYGGRDRIRLMDEQGEVLLRSDWSVEEGRLVFGDETWYHHEKASADTVECLAMEIFDSSLFADRFSVRTYPEVQIGRSSISGRHVGNIGWDALVGSEITVEDTAAELTATIVLRTGHVLELRVPNRQPRRGQLSLRTNAQSAASPLASVVCR